MGMMSLLSQYICRYFLRFFCLGIGVGMALLLLVESFDRLDNFIEHQVPWPEAVRYMALRVPQNLTYMVPVACLLASVLTFSVLSKHSEITAIRSAGVAPLRLAGPLFCLAGVAFLLLLLAQEYLLPYTNQAQRLIWSTRVRHQQVDTRMGLVKRGELWYRAPQRIWHVQLSEPLHNRLLGVTIYEMAGDGWIRRRYDAAEAIWDASGWRLLQGTQRAFDAQQGFVGSPEHFTERRVAFSERPAEISALQKEPNEMGFRELHAHVQQLRHQGLSAALYAVEFHGKFAFAAVCLVMVGFGVPLALCSNRSGGTARAVALTLACGFSYWIVQAMALAFGQTGQLPPVVAAWFGNVCFGAGSIYLAARAR
jgi:lipopolysaccharide export system permease protein